MKSSIILYYVVSFLKRLKYFCLEIIVTQPIPPILIESSRWIFRSTISQKDKEDTQKDKEDTQVRFDFDGKIVPRGTDIHLDKGTVKHLFTVWVIMRLHNYIHKPDYYNKSLAFVTLYLVCIVVGSILTIMTWYTLSYKHAIRSTPPWGGAISSWLHTGRALHLIT